MPARNETVYVRADGDRHGILKSVNSKRDEGTFEVLMKDTNKAEFVDRIVKVTKQDYEMYKSEQPKAKQPAKRGKKS